MKQLLAIIGILIVAPAYSQTHYVSYKNDKHAYYNNAGQLQGFSESRINEVTLNSDSSFEFWSRPNVSCFTWHEYKGSWKKPSDTIRFYDSYEVVENDSRIIYKNNNEQSYNIGFSTDKNSVLKNKNVKVQYVYDYDSHLEDIERLFQMAENNTVEIPFNTIPNFNKLAAIRIEYQLTDNDKRYGYLSENSRFLNVKTRDLSNVISIKFIENPKKEIVHRVITGVIKNDTLIILSQIKSKISLPDYNGDIVFEDSYPLYK